jgi:hypothetical protein
MSFRIEDKLSVNPKRLGDLYSWIADQKGYTLFGKRLVFSTYLDSASMAMFHDSEEGSLPRKKIRIRSYGTTSHSNVKKSLEIKISSIEGRFKTTRDVPEQELAELLTEGFFDEIYGMCHPVVCVAYTREYFAVAGVRLTIDQDIKYRRPDSLFWIHDEAISVEVKAPYSSQVDALEESFPFQRIRFSKYARAINAIQKNTGSWL